MWKKERDALYYSSKNSGGKRSGGGGGGVKSRTPFYTCVTPLATLLSHPCYTFVAPLLHPYCTFVTPLVTHL